MADTTNINITVDGQAAEQDGTPAEPTTPAKSPTASNAAPKAGAAKSQLGTMAVGAYLAKQSFSIASSRVGQYTRDSQLQSQVNAGLQLLGYAGMIAANPVMGSIAVGLSLTTQMIDYNFKRNQYDAARSVALERAGQTNKSR